MSLKSPRVTRISSRRSTLHLLSIRCNGAECGKDDEAEENQDHGNRSRVLETEGFESFPDKDRCGHGMVRQDNHSPELRNPPCPHHDAPGQDGPPGQRQADLEEGLPGRGAQRPRYPLKPRVDRQEAIPGRIHQEREGHEGHGKTDARLCAHKADAHGRKGLAENKFSAVDHQQGDAGGRVRDHYGKIYDSLDKTPSGEMPSGQDIGKGDPEKRADNRGPKGAPEGQQNRAYDFRVGNGGPEDRRIRRQDHPEQGDNDDQHQYRPQSPYDGFKAFHVPRTSLTTESQGTQSLLAPDHENP